MYINSLHYNFSKGRALNNFKGYYKGELTKIIPGNIIEKSVELFLKFWLPWKGKYFYKNYGDNLLPNVTEIFLRLPFGKNIIGKKEKNGFHALPFKTYIAKGLKDDKKVFRLDYNLSKNPKFIKTVIDELVQTGKNEYLGKAYLKEKNDYRLLGFFKLRK